MLPPTSLSFPVLQGPEKGPRALLSGSPFINSGLEWGRVCVVAPLAHLEQSFLIWKIKYLSFMKKITNTFIYKNLTFAMTHHNPKCMSLNV